MRGLGSPLKRRYEEKEGDAMSNGTNNLLSKKNKISIEPYLLISPAILVISLIIAFPICFNVYVSMLDWNLGSVAKPFVGFENYREILTSETFFQVLINTIIWTVVGVGLQMIIGLLLATFVESSKKYVGFLQSVFVIPWIIPGVVASLMWSWMLQADLGIINNILSGIGIISDPILWLGDKKFAMSAVIGANTWKGFPFWFLMLLAGLQSLPAEQIEAAKIDGATKWKIFIHIKIPHLIPVIAATGVITTIWTLNYFDLIYVMTKGGPGIATSTFPIYTYMLGFQLFKFAKSSAMAIISLFVMAILSAPYVRMMMKNISDEGAK